MNVIFLCIVVRVSLIRVYLSHKPKKKTRFRDEMIENERLETNFKSKSVVRSTFRWTVRSFFCRIRKQKFCLANLHKSFINLSKQNVHTEYDGNCE